MNNYIGIILLGTLFSLLFLISEVLYQKKVSKDLTRKIVHIFGGVIVALFPIFLSYYFAIALGVLMSVILYAFYKNGLLKSVSNDKQYDIGMLSFAPALTIVIVIFWNINIEIVQYSALILGVSDGFAGFFGKKYGIKKYNFSGEKTYMGSVVFLLTTVVLLIVFQENYTAMSFISFMYLILSACILTIAEGIVGKGWDNIVLAFLSSIVLYILL